VCAKSRLKGAVHSTWFLAGWPADVQGSSTFCSSSDNCKIYRSQSVHGSPPRSASFARTVAAFRLGYKGTRLKFMKLDNESRIRGFAYLGQESVLRDGPSPQGWPFIEVGGGAESRAGRLWRHVNAANWAGVCGRRSTRMHHGRWWWTVSETIERAPYRLRISSRWAPTLISLYLRWNRN